MTYYNTDTLSLGGGIVRVGNTDMGFCPEFSIQVKIEKDIKYAYYEKDNSIIKVPIKENSEITSVEITGSFVCESLMDSTIQKLGFFSNTGGNLLSALTGFSISNTSIQFESSPLIGKHISFNCKDAFIESNDSINLLSFDTWNNITFTFFGLLDSFETNAPSMLLLNEEDII